MTRRQLVRFEMFRRVRDFGSVHMTQFPEGSVGAQAFTIVRTIVDDLGGHSKVKMASIQEGFRAKKQARLALARQLNEVVRTAKIIARTTPRFDDGFRLPAQRNDQVLITAGRLFIEAAEPAAAQFIAHGMSETFLATLRTKLQQLEESIAACEDGSRGSAAAQAQIAAGLKAGMDAVTRLDIVIANRFKDDVATLAQWTRDRQQRAAHKEQPTEPPAPPAAPSLPETPPSAPVAASSAVEGRAALS